MYFTSPQPKGARPLIIADKAINILFHFYLKIEDVKPAPIT